MALQDNHHFKVIIAQALTDFETDETLRGKDAEYDVIRKAHMRDGVMALLDLIDMNANDDEETNVENY